MQVRIIVPAQNRQSPLALSDAAVADQYSAHVNQTERSSAPPAARRLLQELTRGEWFMAYGARSRVSSVHRGGEDILERLGRGF